MVLPLNKNVSVKKDKNKYSAFVTEYGSYTFTFSSEKDAEATMQKIHDKYIKKVDELYAAKEKEIMTV